MTFTKLGDVLKNFETKEGNIKLQFDDSKICSNHDERKFPDGVVMIYNPLISEFSCPICYKMEQDKILEKEYTKLRKQQEADIKYNTLEKLSIVPDKTILKTSFETYRVDNGSEAHTNALEVFKYSKDILLGKVFNIILTGNPGAGKSHLSYSLLRYVNENSDRTKSCLFIDVSDMVLKIRGSFNNKESRYTEEYFIDLLGSVDVLVMDDLGSEVGNIDTNKTASDFVGRVLRNITNSRQDKVTVFTTNLSSVQLKQVYDEKTASRMLKFIKPVVFKETTDKRMVDLGF